jgi:hypothetical protein
VAPGALTRESNERKKQMKTETIKNMMIGDNQGLLRHDGETAQEYNRKRAILFIRRNASDYCRTLQEGAKYLAGKLLPSEIPHPAVWWEVLRLSKGL